MRFNIDLDNIKYIKILCFDREEKPCTIKAAIKKINEKEIIACAKFDEEFFVETPSDVTLSIVCTDGLYRTKTKLKTVENAEPYLVFVLEVPQGLEYQQNREYFRVPVEYNCVYSIRTQDEINRVDAKTIDISANGVSILLPELVVSDGESYLEISVEGIDIRSRVQYIRSEKLNNGYKVSFKFTQITNQDKDFISKVCIQKQLEQRRNSIS